MASPQMEVERLPSRHYRLFAVVVLALLGGATALGIAGRLSAGPGPAPTAPGVVAVTRTPGPSIEPVEVTEVDCGGLPAAQCESIYSAARAALSPDLPPVSKVAVNASLLCSSAIDCPPAFLSHAYGLGSAVVTFTDGGPDAWMNVVAVADSAQEHAEAWVVRWVPRPSAPRSGGDASGSVLTFPNGLRPLTR